MKKDPTVWLEHVLESIEIIDDHVADTTKVDFNSDVKLQDAVIRRLEIIGEATKNIPERVKEEYPDVLWQKITGMRDILAHEYFRVDTDVVLNTINDDLPELKKQIEKALD